MLKRILDYLRIADAQDDDWYGWVTNQAGHAAYIGMTLAWALLMIGVGPVQTVLLVYFGYGILWEVIIQGGRDYRDSLMDTTHVMAGACILTMALLGNMWGLGIVLLLWWSLVAFGIMRRIGQ